MTKRRDPEHKMGLRTGYDVHPDGSICLAPMWTRRMEDLLASEYGLGQMQLGVNEFVAAQFTHLGKEKKLWWAEVFEELGIPRDEKWVFANGVLSKVSDEPAGEVA